MLIKQYNYENHLSEKCLVCKKMSIIKLLGQLLPLVKTVQFSYGREDILTYPWW